MSLLILESALRALVLAAGAWAVLRLLRVRNVPAQKCAWIVVLAASSAMPILLFISAQWHAWPWATLRIPVISPHWTATSDLAASSSQPAQFSHPAHIQTAAVSGAELVASAPTGRFPAPVLSRDFSAANPPKQAHTSLRLTLSNLFWLAYFAIAGLLLIRLLRGVASVFLLWRNAEPVSLDMPHLAQGLRLRVSRDASSPVSLWAGVLLPADYAAWDAEKLRVVLAHEHSHVRQGDFFLQLLAGLYAALVWFSPLGWWLKRELSDLGEAISDRAGLAEAASTFGYAQVLFEFAAAPRPTLIGVAMARSSSLSRRMERLLNESAFRQAFSGGRRMLLVALAAPILLFAASTFVRVVQAAPAKAQAATTGQSHPDASPILDSADAPPRAQNQAQPAPQPDTASATSRTSEASTGVGDSTGTGDSTSGSITNTNSSDGRHYSYANSGSYSYSYTDNPDHDSYALVMNNDDHIDFSGDWDDGLHEEIERLRKSTNGSFLWFRHDGKSYVITDPAIIQRIAAMYAPMQKLGKEQEELGRQQEALGKKQEALGKAQESVSLVSPDTNEQMAKLKTELAALDKQIDEQVTRATINDLQARLSEVQSRIGAIQGEMGRKQGELGRQQGELGEQQGRLGEQQGRLGEEQGKLAREVDQQVKSIIDQSLKNGTAQPAK